MPSQAIVSDSYWVVITAVVPPSIVSEAFPSIVTVFELLSIFLIVILTPSLLAAAGRVIVKLLLVASTRMMLSSLVAVWLLDRDWETRK